MAYPRQAKHKNEMIVYSILELRDWLGKTLRTERAQDLYRATQWAGHEVQHNDSDCPVCGWPSGRKGFVSAPAMPGEWAFGRLFGCPQCWPYPIGENHDAQFGMSTDAEQQLQAARIRLSARGLLGR